MQLQKNVLRLASTIDGLTDEERKSTAQLLFIMTKQAESYWSPKYQRARKTRLELSHALVGLLKNLEGAKAKVDEATQDLKPFPGETQDHVLSLVESVRSCTTSMEKLYHRIQKVTAIVQMPANAFSPHTEIKLRQRQAGPSRDARTAYGFENPEDAFNDQFNGFLSQAIYILNNSAMIKSKTRSYTFLSEILRALLTDATQEQMRSISAEAVRGRVRLYKNKYGPLDPDSPQKIHRLATVIGWIGES